MLEIHGEIVASKWLANVVDSSALSLLGRQADCSRRADWIDPMNWPWVSDLAMCRHCDQSVHRVTQMATAEALTVAVYGR